MAMGHARDMLAMTPGHPKEYVSPRTQYQGLALWGLQSCKGSSVKAALQLFLDDIARLPTPILKLAPMEKKRSCHLCLLALFLLVGCRLHPRKEASDQC